MHNFVKLLMLKVSLFATLMLQDTYSGATSIPSPQIYPESLIHSENVITSKASRGHILFFHHAGTTSHLNVLKSLAGGLLDRGHRVTTAFYGKSQISHDNYTEIIFPNR